MFSSIKDISSRMHLTQNIGVFSFSPNRMHFSFEMALLFVPRANLQVLSFLLAGLESRRHIFFLVGGGGGGDDDDDDDDDDSFLLLVRS